MKLAVFALAAAAGVSAFAQQSPVTSSGGAGVSSGTGVAVTPSMQSTPATPHLLSGGTTIEQSRNTTTAMGAGGATTQTTVARYWVNVPPNVEQRADFQRWLELK